MLGDLEQAHSFLFVATHAGALDFTSTTSSLLSSTIEEIFIIRVVFTWHLAKEVLLADGAEVQGVLHGAVKFFLECTQSVIEHASPEDLVLELLVDVDQLVHINDLVFVKLIVSFIIMVLHRVEGLCCVRLA